MHVPFHFELEFDLIPQKDRRAHSDMSCWATSNYSKNIGKLNVHPCQVDEARLHTIFASICVELT